MMLITKEIERRAPAMKATENMKESEIKIVAHFFHCSGNWNAYMTEYDPIRREGYGLVSAQEIELGPFSITELEGVVVRGLKVERDLHFGFDMTLERAREIEEQRRGYR